MTLIDTLIDTEALPYVSFVMVILPSIVSSLLEQQHLIVAWEIVRSCVIRAPLLKYLFFPQIVRLSISFFIDFHLNDVLILISLFVSLSTIIRHPLGYIVVLVNISCFGHYSANICSGQATMIINYDLSST